MSKFEIQLRSIDSIRPYENNPRQNDGAVAASLKEFGFRQPIVVDMDGVIIAGHNGSKDQGSPLEILGPGYRTRV